MSVDIALDWRRQPHRKRPFRTTAFFSRWTTRPSFRPDVTFLFRDRSQLEKPAFLALSDCP
ncbi:MAG: hypothetical protein MZV64_71275 [Ignavibacteriales bacterium]|nr:hypothetical protein [Ignavibacteriales bacterium]